MSRTRPRLVAQGTEPSLVEQIAAYRRIKGELASLERAITERGRKIAAAEGRKMMPRFDDICREHGQTKTNNAAPVAAD